MIPTTIFAIYIHNIFLNERGEKNPRHEMSLYDY